MLRALLAAKHPAALDLLAHSVQNVPARDRPEGESVPAVALRLLGERADTPRARALIRQNAFAAPTVNQQLRIRAATIWAATAAREERPLVEALASAAVDPELGVALR